MQKYYHDAPVWRQVQAFLPETNRLTEETLPEEYYLPIGGVKLHIDHYKTESPKATVIMLHGVGGNGRLLSFMAIRLARSGYEVICPDMPLYGFTEYSQAITYDTWVECGCKLVDYYQSVKGGGIFLFGLSAGGMLAYQVACGREDVNGVIATCILDQRNPEVTKKTAVHPAVAAIAAPVLEAARRIFGGVKIPMRLVGNMKAISNNRSLAELLMKDKRSSGASVSVAFLYSMLHPVIKTEPEQFTACPFLLAHPGDDRWTDIELSRLFYDRLACEKDVCFLEDAGHFPIEEKGLNQLEACCLSFLEKYIV